MRPSGDIFQDFASAGSVCCVDRLISIRSPIRRPITSREITSVAVTGLSVFGSARSPMVRCPP